MKQTTIDILIAGDFAARDRVVANLEKENFQPIFGQVKTLVEASDYSIVNLECPVAPETAKPITKNGGNLKCGESAVQALKYAGFKCVTLANNHFRDFGDEGCANTIDVLNKYSIAHLGGGVNLSESKIPHFVEIEGETIAILNFCEHEFSIASETTGGSCPLDLVENYRMISAAKEKA